MQTDTISHDDIRYNAAEEQFEACVAVHAANGSRTYACSVYADLSMTLELAEIALGNAAIARHTCEPALFSTQQALEPVILRAPSRPSWRQTLLGMLPELRGLHTA